MTWGDINSGAVPQPGGIVYRGAGSDSDKTVQEEVAQATQDALNFEGAFESVKAGIEVDKDPAVTVPVVEADDQEASGSQDGEEGEDDRVGYIPVTEDDDQEASGNKRVPKDSEVEDEDDEDGPPAKSANKPEWVAYAVSKGADEDEAEAMTVKELQDQYGE